MFREMARIRQQLTREECIGILRNEKRGVLSVQGDDGYPYGMPMNHYYCEDDGIIYFHGGKKGHKIDAIRGCDKASFCVYDGGTREEGELFLRIRSVIVFGRIRIVEDREKTCEISRKLSFKFTSDEKYIEEEITKFGSDTLLLALIPEHISGKLVKES